MKLKLKKQTRPPYCNSPLLTPISEMTGENAAPTKENAWQAALHSLVLGNKGYSFSMANKNSIIGS